MAQFMTGRKALAFPAAFTVDCDYGALFVAGNSRRTALERLVNNRGLTVLRDSLHIQLFRFGDAQVDEQLIGGLEDGSAHESFLLVLRGKQAESIKLFNQSRQIA